MSGAGQITARAYFVRAELGAEVQMVCLEMALEDQMVRVRARHAGDEASVDMMKVAIAG